MVRAFTHRVMGQWIDPSWWTHRAVSCSSQCSTTDNKGHGMCYPVWDSTYKRILVANRKDSLKVADIVVAVVTSLTV